MTKKKENFFSIESTIELNFLDAHYRDIAYSSFMPEFKKLKTNRSEIIVEKKENSISFRISSKDITAFRASINEIITFGKIADNCFYLIEKF
jgi:tRNA threonylcarbamoyladenosine modification (KEOPS) complex  Pcc1 subunit